MMQSKETLLRKTNWLCVIQLSAERQPERRQRLQGGMSGTLPGKEQRDLSQLHFVKKESETQTVSLSFSIFKSQQRAERNRERMRKHEYQ